VLAGIGAVGVLVVLAIIAATVLPGLGGGQDRAGGAPDAEPGAGVYASANFAVPFRLAAPTWLAPAPRVDERELVTWQTADEAIRFLVPVEVYPPGKKRPVPTPQDYLTYLLSQSVAGARFTDRSLTTVGGQPATLVTATASRRLAGAIGCSQAGMAQRHCYGLRPERRLRIAIVELDGRTLLIWLRNDRRSRFEEQRVLFEQTLSTVQFR